MKRKRSFTANRPRTALGGGLLFLITCCLIAGGLLVLFFSGAAWALFGIAFFLALLLLGMIIPRASGPASADQPEEPMEPSRLEALISLFASLENRTTTQRSEESSHLVEQTEEEYQKEQAEWLAKVKRKQGDKKEKPPTGRD